MVHLLLVSLIWAFSFGLIKTRLAGIDPVLASRSASPLALPAAAPPDAPLAQVQRVYNAAHEPTVAAIREFARVRGADKSPFGWRKYVVSQQQYLRFCCHATISELVQNGVCRAPKVNEVDDG